MDLARFVNVLSRGASREAGVSMRPRDIERFGPALLMDRQLEDGHRLLVWTE